MSAAARRRSRAARLSTARPCRCRGRRRRAGPGGSSPRSAASPLMRTRLVEQQSTSLRIWPLQQRYQAPWSTASTPWRSGTQSSQRRVRGARRQRRCRRAARSGGPSASTGRPEASIEPAEVVDRAPVARAQRVAARVDARQRVRGWGTSRWSRCGRRSRTSPRGCGWCRAAAGRARRPAADAAPTSARAAPATVARKPAGCRLARRCAGRARRARRGRQAGGSDPLLARGDQLLDLLQRVDQALAPPRRRPPGTRRTACPGTR